MQVADLIYLTGYRFIYIFRSLFPFWASGILIGAFLSVFLTRQIASFVGKYYRHSLRWLYYGVAALIGIISPICMYGTVPIIMGLKKKEIKEPILVSFMVGSILLNPNLIILTMLLGAHITIIRVIVVIIGGQIAGILTDIYKKRTKKNFYKNINFEYHSKSELIKKPFKRYVYGLNKTIVKTTPYFFIGILITVLIEQYVPLDIINNLFNNNFGLGVLFATTLGVPLYACGGGTIPILKALMVSGLSIGAATAFMISGPMTKINNIGAVKLILGKRHFVYYIIYAISYSFIVGVIINIAVQVN